MIVTKEDTTKMATCWSCKRLNPVLALPHVRVTKCRCGAVHPSLRASAVVKFFNADKQTAAFL